MHLVSRALLGPMTTQGCNAVEDVDWAVDCLESILSLSSRKATLGSPGKLLSITFDGERESNRPLRRR